MMNKYGWIVVLIVMVSANNILTGQTENHDHWFRELCQQDSLSNEGFGILHNLEEKGIDLCLSATQIYQQNLNGGLRTSDHSGRYTGSYDLETVFDGQKALGMTNPTLLYIASEGSWPTAEGITDESVGSMFSINDDAAGHRSLDITELWFAQELLGGNLKYRIGKMDVTSVFFATPGIAGAFDASEYANDETGQFVAGPLVNNPTIPFPDNGLGAEVMLCLGDDLHMYAAAVDAQADARETGVNTTFHQEDYFFAIAEANLTAQMDSPRGPLSGSYRVGLWYDPQTKDRFNGGTKRNDTGFYASFDQMLYKENITSNDTQGLGAFVRYGWANSRANEITNFWSLGLQYQGLLPNRDDDVFGAGIAQGIFSDQADIPSDAETITEFYYNAQVTPWLNVTPAIQYIAQPAGHENATDAIVMTLRTQIQF